MLSPLSHRVVDPIMNLISETHHLRQRKTTYLFVVYDYFTIIVSTRLKFWLHPSKEVSTLDLISSSAPTNGYLLEVPGLQRKHLVRQT